jgi:myosin heavy subunit
MNKNLTIFNNSRRLETKYYNLKITKSKLIIELLKDKLIGKIKEIENLNGIIQKLEDENSVLKNTNTELIQAAHDTKTNDTETNSLIDNMNRENEKMCKKLESIKKENEKLNRQLDDVKNEKQELEEHIGNVQNEYRVFKDETGRTLHHMDEKILKLEKSNERFRIEKDDAVKNKIDAVSNKLEEENMKLRNVIDNLENLNKKYQKDANEYTKLMKVFENINCKIDDLKKEVLDKNQILKEEIRAFKHTMSENCANIGRMKSSAQEDNIKDNTIKILKESLKIKDKLLSQKTLKNKTVNEDMKDVIDREFVYGDSLILEDNVNKVTNPTKPSKKNTDGNKSAKRVKTSDNDLKKNEKSKNTEKPLDKKKTDVITINEEKNQKTEKNKKTENVKNEEKNVKTEKNLNTENVKTKKNDFDTIVKNSKKILPPTKKDPTCVSKKQETKLNPWKTENSFFANLSFADSSPVQRKFDKQ